jgi:hypothetical protein
MKRHLQMARSGIPSGRSGSYCPVAEQPKDYEQEIIRGVDYAAVDLIRKLIVFVAAAVNKIRKFFAKKT